MTLFFYFQEAIRGSGWRGQTFAHLEHRVGWKPLVIALLLWALGMYSLWILPLLVLTANAPTSSQRRRGIRDETGLESSS